MPDPYLIVEVDPKTEHTAYVDICKMHQACFPEDLMYLPDSGYWWIAYKGTEPVAFAGLTHVKGDVRVSKVFGYLCRAAVMRKHRGHGLQRRLIEVRLDKARNLKMKTICTSTFENFASGNNLIAAGFRLYVPNNTWGREGTNYWQLKLNEV